MIELGRCFIQQVQPPLVLSMEVVTRGATSITETSSIKLGYRTLSFKCFYSLLNLVLNVELLRESN